jgi:hypothetical protein
MGPQCRISNFDGQVLNLLKFHNKRFAFRVVSESFLLEPLFAAGDSR